MSSFATELKRKSLLWSFLDTGVASGTENMLKDRETLAAVNQGRTTGVVLRFFEWKNPTLSYGYLLNPNRIREWAEAHQIQETVQRPTAGGAVIHGPDDLSLSLCWPRHQRILPENPRSCYEIIHTVIKEGLARCLDKSEVSLYVKSRCAEAASPTISASHFSICFETPVCNDVMLERRKIAGGALRVMKNAILYQGALQLRHVEKQWLKTEIRASFGRRFA